MASQVRRKLLEEANDRYKRLKNRTGRIARLRDDSNPDPQPDWSVRYAIPVEVNYHHKGLREFGIPDDLDEDLE